MNKKNRILGIAMLVIALMLFGIVMGAPSVFAEEGGLISVGSTGDQTKLENAGCTIIEEIQLNETQIMFKFVCKDQINVFADKTLIVNSIGTKDDLLQSKLTDDPISSDQCFKINGVSVCRNIELHILDIGVNKGIGITPEFLSELQIMPFLNSDSPVIAILDTGINLQNNLQFSRSLYSNAAGINFVKERVYTENGSIRYTYDPMDIDDRQSHGTHVASIALGYGGNTYYSGSNLNAIGLVPGGVRLLVVKVADQDGAATSEAMIKGIYWAVDHGADVISMSIGGFEGKNSYCNDAYPPMTDAVNYALAHNVSLVFASGNFNEWLPGTVWPACIEGVIPVGAVSKNDVAHNNSFEVQKFSGAGELSKIVFPGVDIFGACLGYSFCFKTGTSMATPGVAAIVALMKMQNPCLTPRQVEKLLYQNAIDLGEPGWDKQTGFGLANSRAIIAAKQERLKFLCIK